MDLASPYQIVGTIGFLTYMGSYAALQAGWLQGSGTGYTLANLLAALLVLVSLSETFNLPSALIQISWVLISLYGLARIARRGRARRTTAKARGHLARGAGGRR